MQVAVGTTVFVRACHTRKAGRRRLERPHQRRDEQGCPSSCGAAISEPPVAAVVHRRRKDAGRPARG